jgi:hypothetical protein
MRNLVIRTIALLFQLILFTIALDLLEMAIHQIIGSHNHR